MFWTRHENNEYKKNAKKVINNIILRLQSKYFFFSFLVNILRHYHLSKKKIHEKEYIKELIANIPLLQVTTHYL